MRKREKGRTEGGERKGVKRTPRSLRCVSFFSRFCNGRCNKQEHLDDNVLDEDKIQSQAAAQWREREAELEEDHQNKVSP